MREGGHGLQLLKSPAEAFPALIKAAKLVITPEYLPTPWRRASRGTQNVTSDGHDSLIFGWGSRVCIKFDMGLSET